MKIAVVLIPKAGEVTLLLNNTHRPPRYFILGRGLEFSVLSFLLLCTLALAVWNFLPGVRFDAAAVWTPEAPADPFIPAVPARAIARSFDGSRPLRAGDMVVVNDEKAPTVRQVAAASGEAAVLRDGNLLKAFYVVGEGNCVVVSNQQFSTVRADGIRATVSPF